MKHLFELFPVILFFITLKVAEKTHNAANILSHIMNHLGIDSPVKPELVPIMLATVVVIIASLLQILWVKIRHGNVSKTLLFSAALVTIMGGLTLYLQNDAFIKWKPTLLYWGTSIAFIVAERFWKKNFIRTMLEKEIQLPEPIWLQLNWAWALFFIIMGSLNIWIAYHFSTETWATFKLFGTFGLMILFTIAQSIYISKYTKSEDKS